MLHGRHRLQPDSEAQASRPKTYRQFNPIIDPVTQVTTKPSPAAGALNLQQE